MMLPDLVSLKRDIQVVFDEYLRQKVQQHMGVFNQAPKQMIHEGARTRMIRADGSAQESELKQASVEMLTKLSEVNSTTFQDRLRQLDEMAEKMAAQMSKHMFESLDETLQESGQTFDARGRPLDAEAILNVMRTIQLDFDESGKHSEISIVVGAALREKMKAAFQNLMHEPALRKQYEELIDQKRLEWRDREAARKLVG